MPHRRNRCASSPELKAKLTFALLFSLPVLSTLLLLLLLYLFYLRYRGVDLGYLRTPRPVQPDPRPFAAAELGLKEELREMLPVLIYKESFSVKDTQCSVCLGDYHAEDRLQQIPACGHAFHMECRPLAFYAHNLSHRAVSLFLLFPHMKTLVQQLIYQSNQAMDHPMSQASLSICWLVEKHVPLNFV